jgi:uncharacterized membrane protein YesL
LAGFFGLFDYSKPGKGVRKDEPKGSRFMYFWKLFFRKFWRLCQLNLLYTLFCVPVIAVGLLVVSLLGGDPWNMLYWLILIPLVAFCPANAGMTYVLRNLATEQPVFMFSDFWDAVKTNWKQSTLYCLLMTFCSIVVVVSVQFYNMNSGMHSWMFLPAALCIFIGLMLYLMSFYVMLMIVTLDLPFRAIIKNSFILAVLCIKANLLTLLFTGILIVATALFFPLTLVFMAFCVPAWIGFIVCYNSYPGIQKYAIDPFLEQQEAQQSIANQTDSLFDDEGPMHK